MTKLRQTITKCKLNVIFALAKRFDIMENLPTDITILFSFINTKLRDDYASLDELCDELHIDRQWLIDTLAKGGFEYNSQLNKFW